MEKRYITIKSSISSDGLGVPSVSLYFSYCDKRKMTGSFCKGCQNKDLQKDGIGSYLSIEEVINITESKINYFLETFNDCKVSFIGGEPLAKINRDFVIELSKKYKKKNINTLIYTWRYIEDIEKENINIDYFDEIVCGEYIEGLKQENSLLGSSNQYIYEPNKKQIRRA